MITVGEKTIKLQIWDTVIIKPHRQGNNPSNPLPEATIDQPQAPSLSTISPTANPSITSLDGFSKPR
jgi:hypothetical protein